MSDDSFFNIKDAKVTYKSNNPAVASVDETGLVTAVASGLATIAAEVTINEITKSDGYPLKVVADLTLSSIEANGEKIADFSADNLAYSFLVKDGSAKIPKISATSTVEGTKMKIKQATSVPGTALITLTDNNSGLTGSYAVNFGTMSFSDAFESTTLKEGWTWIRENKDNWSLTESPKNLTITSKTGDIKGVTNNAENILLQSANTDWSVTSRMEFSKRPSKPDQQGGIIAYQDDDNYVKLAYINSVKGFMGSNEYIELLVEREGEQYSAANIPTTGLVPDDIAVVLKLEKKGSWYTAYYATGGKDFVLLGSTDAVLHDIKAGLFACDGGEAPKGMFPQAGNADDANKPFKVRFDYFDITNTGN
jgi:hypothetical protein